MNTYLSDQILPLTQEKSLSTLSTGLGIFWLLVAALVTIGSCLSVLNAPFTGHHLGWVSGHFSVMARSFSEMGLETLGPVPIQNNPPLGTIPDIYTHWPPLFPILLSVVFQLFGESAAAARGLMLVILSANCLVMFYLLKIYNNAQAAIFTVFAILVAPALIKYGTLVFQLPLAIMWMLLAILGFLKATENTRLHRGWTLFGLATLILAIFTSWEPVMCCPGLLAASLWNRKKSMVFLALVYCLVAVMSVASVLLIYFINYPSSFDEFFHRFKFRLGLEPNSQLKGMSNQQPSVKEILIRYWSYQKLLGQIGLAMIGSVLVNMWILRSYKHSEHVVIILAALFAPPLLWFLFVSSHAYWHDYQMVLAVPAMAVCFGISVGWILNLIQHHVNHRYTQNVLIVPVFIILPLVMVYPLFQGAWHLVSNAGLDSPTLIHAREIQAFTTPGSVVLSPYRNRMITYYSKRRIIHQIENDAHVEEVVATLDTLFPNHPATFLALRPSETNQFLSSRNRYPLVEESDNLVLLRIKYLAPR